MFKWNLQYSLWPGPHYTLGTTATVPRAYDMFRAYEGMDEETIKIK